MVHDRFPENYDSLKAQAREFPSEPGVYLWRDRENRIIYAGKARNLKNRIMSYFANRKDAKISALLRNSISLETIITSNEYEALLLENTLIKQHSPKYNVSLKDGKTYPVIRISSGEFPRVFSTRNKIEDGSLYFGPFPNIFAINKIMEMIQKLFPLRKCRTFKKRDKPCMYYHIKRCLAPCCREVKDYQEQVERVRKLLAGETSSLIAELTGRMHNAAAALQFEEAADIRNLIRAIESLSESNSVEDMDPEGRDYIAWAMEGIFTTISVLSMRDGRMTGQELYSTRSAAEEDETIETFITSYYSPDRSLPEKIYLGKIQKNGAVLDESSLNRFFSERFSFVPELISPKDEEKKHIAALSMAYQNAKEELRKRLRERGAGPALDELKQAINLKTRPESIEGFDISHLGGKHTTASMISFKNGIPDRKNYRHYKIRTLEGKIDDYASLREAVRRRYSYLLRENLEIPDLILIDGGLGQVNTVKTVLDSLGINTGLIGIAKREEEIWLPGAKQPVKLPERSEALKVLQHLRDETHRFAGRLSRKLRSNEISFPVLESIEGIGKKRAAIIMLNYGDLEKISAADPEDLAERCGIKITAAKAVRAAVRLELEKKKRSKNRQLKPGKPENTSALLAAEALADYSGKNET